MAAVFGHNVARLLTEAAMGKQTHLAIEKSEPAPDTKRSLYSPVPKGTEVSGWLKK